MGKRSIFLTVILFLSQLLIAQQPVNESALRQEIVRSATTMANLYKSGEYKGYIQYIHPVIIQGVGGETKMLGLLNQQRTQIKNQGVVINNITFDAPTAIVSAKHELQCTISQHTELRSAKGRVVTYTTLVAISIDNGKTWKFVDTSKMDLATVRKLLPNLSNNITLPPKKKPMVYPE